jgi:phosphoribosylformylglycinamidine synthase
LGEIGNTIGGSRYLQVIHGKKTGACPKLDLKVELALHKVLIEAAGQKILQSAHDCSDGGFALALAECCFTGATHEAKNKGVKSSLPGKGRVDGRLFGETQSRAIVSCKPSDAEKLESLAKQLGVPFEKLGVVGGDTLIIGEEIHIPVSTAGDLFFTAIEKMMS